MNDIQDQIDELTGTSPAVAQQEADNIASSTPDTNATTHLYGMGLEKQDALILQEEASGEGRGIDMSPDAMGTVTGTAIPDNTYNTSYVTDSDGKHLLFDPNTYDAMPWPELNIKEKDALAQMAQAYFAVGANREPENYIGYTPLARDGSLSWWSHLVGGTQKMAMNVIPSLPKATAGAGLVTTYTLANILANPFQLISNSGSALANTGFGRWAKGVADKLEDTQVAVEQMADVVDKTLDPIERTVLATYDADMSDTSMKAELGRGMGSALGMVLTARGLMGLNIGVNAPALTASIFGLSEVNELRHKALDAGVSPEWARAYATGGAGVVIATDVAEIMGGMGMLTLTYKAGKDIVKSWKNRGLVHYLKKEGLDVLAEAGLEDVQETVEGWYDPEFQENPIDRLFVAGVSAGALRLLGVPASVRHAKLADQMALAEAAGVGPQYASAVGILNSTIDELIEKGAIDEGQRMDILRAAISEAPDAIIEELRLAQKGGIQAIPEETRRNFAQTLKAIQSNYQGDVFSSQTMRQLDSETDLALAGIRNGLSDAEVSMIKGIVRGAYVVAAVANANNPKYKGFTIPKFIVAKNAEGYSYYDRNKNEIGIHEGRSNTEYTNISPDYARRLDSNFVPASRQSDKMASILHEMSHWMDAMVGEKGFGDFLEHYYNNIALAFGKEKARELYTDREGKGKSKGRPSEYFAQTIARLGKRSAEAFGLGKSEANRFLSYANMVMNQLGALKGKDGEALRQSIVDFQDALQRVTKANMGHLADIIDAYGTDNIKRALRNFNKDSEGFNDFAEYLANKDMLSELFDVMDSFSDATGMAKINDLFDGDQDAMENFVTMGDKMFREGYDKAVDEVRQRRAEAKKTTPKPVEAKPDPDAIQTLKGILISSTTDSSQVNEDGVQYEQVAYASTPIELEGEHLDADKYYATGEAGGKRGRAMRWSFGNYLNKSPVINKKYYYDMFVKRSEKEQSNVKIIDPQKAKDVPVDAYESLIGIYDWAGKQTEIDKKIPIKKVLNGLKEQAKTYEKQAVQKEEEAQKLASKILEDKDVSEYINKNFDGDKKMVGGFIKEKNSLDKLTDLLLAIGQPEIYDPHNRYPKELLNKITQMNEYKPLVEALNGKGTLKAKSLYANSDAKYIEDFLSDSAVLYIGEKPKALDPHQYAFLIPDNEYLIDAQKPLYQQTKYVQDRVNQILDKYDYENSYTASNRNSHLYDVDRSELNGEDIMDWLTEDIATEELENPDNVDRNRFARDVMADHGIKGVRTMGRRDSETFNVFRSKDNTKYRQLHEQGGIQYETQDWAKAALAKDSVKESFEAGKQEKKQIAADTKIDGRDLTDDINMANQGLTQRLKQPMNKFVKWASSSSWGWGLDRILVTILGRETAEKLDIAGKYSAKQNIRSRYWDEFMARLNPLFGDPKTNTEFMFKYKTMVTNLGFARMTGVEMIDPANPAITSTRDITGWEAMYVYLMKEQGFGDRVQRSTTTNIDDIIATLSEDEKAFALHMSDQLMSMYEKAFGKSKYAHYFPILDAEHELFDELSIDSLMARQNTDDAIAITDAGRIFSQYVSRWASHESNYFQTMKRTRDIFRYTGVDKNEMGPMYTFDLEQDNARKRASAQVAAEVRQVIGEDGYRNLMNLIESELQDGQEQMFDASRNKTLTQMGNNIIKSILANKMMSFPKNIVNVFMFWGGAQDQSRYWNSFAEGLGNFKDTFDYMMKHSPEIKQRWGAAGGINEYLDQRTLGGSTAPIMKGVSKAFAKMDWTGDKTQNMAKFSAVMDMLGDTGLKLFMQSGDMIANVYGGYGLVKDFMAQGMSEAEAFRKLDRYIIEHQSSSNLAMKPLVQKLQNKSLMGQVFAFTSEGVAKWASILGTFDEVKMGTATKSEALANVVSIAISMTLYSLLAAGAWDLLDDDEKVQEETVKALGNTLLDQVFGGMVAGNAFITPAISYLVGDSRVSGMSVPIYNFALDGISALKKGEYDRVITKAMSALGMPVGADNLWNTYLGMSLLNDPNPDVRYAGRLMLAGFTPSRSAKRAGIKKESLEKNDEE